MPQQKPAPKGPTLIDRLGKLIGRKPPVVPARGKQPRMPKIRKPTSAWESKPDA